MSTTKVKLIELNGVQSDADWNYSEIMAYVQAYSEWEEIDTNAYNDLEQFVKMYNADRAKSGSRLIIVRESSLIASECIKDMVAKRAAEKARLDLMRAKIAADREAAEVKARQEREAKALARKEKQYLKLKEEMEQLQTPIKRVITHEGKHVDSFGGGEIQEGRIT